MTALEERLRRDLPALADALVEELEAGNAHPTLHVDGSAVEIGSLPPPPRHRRWRMVTAAAASVVIVVLGAVLIGTRGETDQLAVDAGAGSVAVVKIPTEFGTWEPIAEAPLSPRSHAVSAWTGTEAVFWAGSSLDRTFAHTDGAAYDPASGTWRPLDVPGWGHPGLTSAFLDGLLFLLSKGFALSFDPTDGTVIDLPHLDSMLPVTFATVDGEPWAVGPATFTVTGQPDLAVSRYDRERGEWTDVEVFEGTEQHGETVRGISRLESTVLATAHEIVVWGNRADGIAYDPGADLWRSLLLPDNPRGTVLSSRALDINGSLHVLVEIDGPDGRSIETARDQNGSFVWQVNDAAQGVLEVPGFEAATVVAAVDWAVILSPDDVPVTLHVPSGAWERHVDGPFPAGVHAPNTVWTGEQLVAWGGFPGNLAKPHPTTPFVWTPPRP